MGLAYKEINIRDKAHIWNTQHIHNRKRLYWCENISTSSNWQYLAIRSNMSLLSLSSSIHENVRITYRKRHTCESRIEDKRSIFFRCWSSTRFQATESRNSDILATWAFSDFWKKKKWKTLISTANERMKKNMKRVAHSLSLWWLNEFNEIRIVLKFVLTRDWNILANLIFWCFTSKIYFDKYFKNI